MIEPEIKLVFVCLFLLMVLADAAHGHAVLPAFVLGQQGAEDRVLSHTAARHRVHEGASFGINFAANKAQRLPGRRALG